MFVNTGNNLFLPEGDDYSKTEFDSKSEEVAAEGNQLLIELREQQQREKALNMDTLTQPLQHKTKKPEKPLKEKDEKLSYKEIFDSVAGKRK